MVQVYGPIGSAQEATLSRAKNTFLPSVEFEGVDVREVLRQLCQRALIGGTISPDVQGPVTLNLRNVDWETALQNVTRQVGATYRFSRGWLYVVPYESSPLPQEGPTPDPLVDAYDSLAQAVATGRGGDLRSRLKPGFEVRNATETKRGEVAYRALVGSFRNSSSFTVERTWPSNLGKGVEALLVYRRIDSNPLYYHDSWREVDGSLRLVSREETVRNPSRRFRNVLLSEILKTVGEDIGITLRIDPSLDRRVTVDLTGATFETVLGRLTRAAGLTYRIEGGVYEIVRREG